jgi:hypothetical protein
MAEGEKDLEFRKPGMEREEENSNLRLGRGNSGPISKKFKK